MQILWWYWLILGLLLVIAELTVAGGFYLIFFGVAAVVVGVLSAFDLAGPTVGQLVLFSCLAVGSLLVFRARLLRWFQRDPQRPAVDPIIGAVAVVVDDLAPGRSAARSCAAPRGRRETRRRRRSRVARAAASSGWKG